MNSLPQSDARLNHPGLTFVWNNYKSRWKLLDGRGMINLLFIWCMSYNVKGRLAPELLKVTDVQTLICAHFFRYLLHYTCTELSLNCVVILAFYIKPALSCHWVVFSSQFATRHLHLAGIEVCCHLSLLPNTYTKLSLYCVVILVCYITSALSCRWIVLSSQCATNNLHWALTKLCFHISLLHNTCTELSPNCVVILVCNITPALRCHWIKLLSQFAT